MTQPDDALTTSREVREQHAGKTEALDKVKALTLLPGDTYVTTEMLATYFEVDIETVKKVTQRSQDELESDGYRVIEGSELRDMKSLSGIGGRARSLALFPRRAVLRFAMLLRDSRIARQVRDYLLDAEQRMPDMETLDGRIEVVSKWLTEMQARRDLQVVNAQQAKAIEEAAPKVNAYEKVINSDGLIDMTSIADALGIGVREMTGWLVEQDIFRRQRSNENNRNLPRKCWQPTHFVVKQEANGRVRFPVVYATGEGFDLVVSRYLASKHVALTDS